MEDFDSRNLVLHQIQCTPDVLWQGFLVTCPFRPVVNVRLTKIQHVRFEMLRVHLNIMEHGDSLGEYLAIEVLPGSVDSNEITGAIYNAELELTVLKDDRSEDVDGDLAQGFLLGEQIGAIEVAEDPVDVFLIL